MHPEVWRVGNAEGMSSYFNALAASVNEIVKETNPFGVSANCWKVTDPSLLNTGGGYDTANVNVLDSRTYRFTVYFKKKVDQNGNCYFGCSGTSTLNLAGTENTNPYFWNGDLPTLNEWYLLVGYVHSNDYTGSSIGGIYNMKGEKVVSITDYKMKAGATTQKARHYLYYVTAGAPELFIYAPCIELVDGTELSLDKYFPNIIAIANSAQATADQAQASATTANNLLADIASDSKLTPVEKTSVREEWDVIAAEVPVNDTQATAFGITTEKTTYDNAFQSLATYLNAGVAWSSGVPSWIADAILSTTTDIVGSTFRANWKAYYDARTALLNAIAAKAKALADTAQDTADKKITVWADLATAQANAETNDVFLASGLLYRCLSPLAATYDRITP